MQFLCSPGSVYIHELGPYHLAAAMKGEGFGGEEWRCPEVLALGAKDGMVVMRLSGELSFQEEGGALQLPGTNRSLEREVCILKS